MPVLLIGVAMLVASCSSGTTDTTTGVAEVATTSTVTTTSVDETISTALAPETGLSVIKDIVFLEVDGHEYLLDVYVPDGEGPFPVVLAFHGAAPSLKNDSYLTVVAKAAAEAGMVVFTPSWVQAFTGSVMPEDLTSGYAASACAFAFAHQEAIAYGGDPERIVTYGFSAGSPEAAWLALGHAAAPLPGCVADGSDGAPVGAVLGDSEYFLHTALFQAGFDTDPGGMQNHVSLLVDPTAWPDGLSARFRIWSAADGTESRSFDDAWDDDGWLAQRDPDGSIREDLDTLGQLDDGIISFIDEGLLLAYRLESIGADVTIDEFPGGHVVHDKVPELVAYLLDAAGTGDEDLFAAPAVYEQLASDYCSAWPDVAGLLSEDAGFAAVSADSLAVPDKGGFAKGISEDVVQGHDAVVTAVADIGFSAVDCGGPAVVSGDWVAMPVSASSTDGSGTTGIWILRIVKDKVQWHLAYGTDVDAATPASTEPDPVLATEAREFCAIVEGTGYARDADEFLAAMTGDPLVHNIPEGLYWTGVDELRSMVTYYPSADEIWCGDDIATNGQWSAEPITIDNPGYYLSQVGMMIHHHVDGKINSQFAHFTRASGEYWGLPLDG